MAECDECFICFESKESDVTGTLVDLHTGGCGCSHPVHEWCLVKWYMIYGKRRNECPLCKMPGAIRDIDALTEKFRDRIPVRALLVDNDDDDEGIQRHYAAVRRRVRTRAYIAICMGLFIILMILYLYIYDNISPEDTHQKYHDNITPWDDFMG